MSGSDTMQAKPTSRHPDRVPGMSWQRREGWWHDACSLCVLLVLAMSFMWPAWTRPNGLWYTPGAAYSDLTVTHWPNMWFVSETFRQHGQIPLWRPLIMGGAPFVGNPLSALFYPPNWLFLFAPVSLTFHLLIGLHLFASGAALYGLVRCSYRRSAAAACAAGVGYMLTPKLAAHLGAGHIGLSQAFAWLPLTVWLLRSAIARQSWRRAAWCGVALAATFLADPRVAFYAALLLAFYALYRLVALWRALGGRAALTRARGLVPVLLCFALAGAVQIAPTVELMALTSRADLTLVEAGRDSLPWRYLIGYLIADRGGYHEWMTYLGLLPLGLALLALLRAEGEVRFWAAVAAIGVLFSLGTHAPFYPALFRLLPGLGWLRVPPRALLLVALSVNLLAGLGVDVLLASAWSSRVRRRAVLAAVAGLLLCGGVGVGFGFLLGDRLPAAVAGFAIAGSGAMLVLLSGLWRRVPRGVTQGLVVAVLVLDLWPVARSSLELRPAEQVFAEGAAPADDLSAREGLFRVYSPSYSIGQHVGARHGLEQLDGVDPSQLRWVAQYMSQAGGYPVSGYGVTIPFFPDDTDVHATWREAVPDAGLLGLLNGRFVVSEFPIEAPGLTFLGRSGSSYLYGNERVLPRAFTVTHVEPVSSWQAAQQRLGDGFDPAGGALVEGGPALDGPHGWQEAMIRSLTPNRIVVEAQVPAPALLVLSEVWYPGWQVIVDGARRPYYRVDGVVRGVYLDPGAHVVEWQYRPASLRWGATITLATLLGLVALEWARHSRPDRAGAEAGQTH
jgi:hypothetical protein